MSADVSLEQVLRRLTPQVLGTLVRRFGRFDSAEDAVQEALLVAARHWRDNGVPEQPFAWLLRVAARKLTDLLRAEQARRRREATVAGRMPPDERVAAPADAHVVDADDTLILLTLCCHPALSPSSQIALTLRAVGGLTTPEIARALLTSEAAIARRITRAKRSVRDSGMSFSMPPAAQRPQRLASVQHVLYLIFTEGYTATSGPDLHRPDLAAEAIRLAEIAADLLPDDSEATGLLALMLLTDARAPARLGGDGRLVPLREQDRTRWKRGSIRRGVQLISRALPSGPVGPYQLQAAIAAVHDEASSHETTDWRQIVVLYRLLLQVAPSPVARLGHAVAVAMVDGPQAGLTLLDAVDDPRLAQDRRLPAARAHLLEMAGEDDVARVAYLRAAQLATNLHQLRYLNAQAQRLASDCTG